VVADRERVGELVAALSELPSVEVVVSSGGDDSVELFTARRPAVVLVTASLENGDARSLIATLRGQSSRGSVAIVVVGDDAGPIRTALDALELAPDRFVSRPLSPRALRFAVTGGIDTVRAARGASPPPPPVRPVSIGGATGRGEAPSSVTGAIPPPRLDTQPGGTPPPRPPRVPSSPPRPPARQPSVVGAASAAASSSPAPSAAPPLASSSPLASPAPSAVPPMSASPISPAALAASPAALPPLSASAITAITPSPPPPQPAPPSPPSPSPRWSSPASSSPASSSPASSSPASSSPASSSPASSSPASSSPASSSPASPPASASGAADAAETGEPDTRAALRARWEALADSMADLPGEDDDDEPLPPPPLVIKPRRRQSEPTGEVLPAAAWKPGSTDEIAPLREPTLILREPEPPRAMPPLPPVPPPPATPESPDPAVARTLTPDGEVVVAARTTSDELWSDPTSIPALAGPPDPASDSGSAAAPEPVPSRTVAQAVLEPAAPAAASPANPKLPDGRDAIDAAIARSSLADELPGEIPDRRVALPGELDAAERPDPLLDAGPGGPAPRDFARELRAKMSMMAHRLFHSGGAPVVSPADHAPRHDHHTEIDLAALGDDPLHAGVAELEGQRPEPGELATSPGSWDSQVRERGLPDAGMIVRGVSDAAMLLARMFAQGATGRVGFRRDEVETVVYFDRGRPVFTSSNEPRDRMGELLLREGKITASQLERCQAVVAESGRRMGEILVDFGYLKRRELLPAVRRHVEDLVYSLFGWERGTYAITLDAEPSAERIRLSRHPAALILEGIRRKLDRTSLERLVGSGSTVIEVRDRDRLGGIVHAGDLAAEERAALAAFDGQADLAQVARSAGVDIADVLPLAWALCVLGLATARRADAEVPDEATALVGETDLAIDRDRVRARWQLVTEADYFALLGVRRDATGFEIRRAYQSARRDFAADCFPTELRRELARELDDIASVLDEAFRVLRDDRLRQTYLANLVES
jgi:CheY-like chemotaxis protein